MTDKPQDPALTPEQENEALAAELVLGLLEGEEELAAINRVSSDPEFSRTVLDWQERFAGIGENVTSVMPPARAWHTIRERLGHSVAPLTEDPTEPLAWWRGPKGWLAGFLAVAAVIALLWFPANAPVTGSDTEYQAELISDDESLQVLARLEGDEIAISLEQGTADDGRDFEIWWIKPDGSAPISIGLVPKSGSAKLDLPDDLEAMEGVKIALSDEPAGGSPTGVVTGEIVAIADLTSL